MIELVEGKKTLSTRMIKDRVLGPLWMIFDVSTDVLSSLQGSTDDIPDHIRAGGSEEVEG